ncbi:hypothetical protein [Blastomonas natatoria]|uniref:hypothetical protein n=1 Tax=Blastomonas natatoria TaxID=34015 RepID=UPI000D7635E8|nr:hypothetical protein [Blastomonas natatoria]
MPNPGWAASKIDRGHGSFFNKPGATAEIATREIESCRKLASGAESQINTIDVLAGGIAAVLGGALADGDQKRINTENCMLIRGWNLYAMTREEGRAWKALPEAERNAQLALLVGAEKPARGSLLRTWHNDYAEPALWQKN